MKKRIYFHGDNMESLHQHIDSKYLPERYGGIHEDYSYKSWINYFSKNEIVKKELKSMGYVVEDDD